MSTANPLAERAAAHDALLAVQAATIAVRDEVMAWLWLSRSNGLGLLAEDKATADACAITADALLDLATALQQASAERLARLAHTPLDALAGMDSDS
jgi:hypothetical protein